MRTVWEEYSDTVVRTPGAPAVDDGKATYTYAELDKQVRFFQASLIGMGVGEGELVGVLMCRDFRLPAMLLALFGLGAAYLPLDPCDPAERKLRAARLAGSKVVVGNAEHIETLITDAEDTVQSDGLVLHAVEDMVGGQLPDRVAGLPSRVALAYVLMTSGSMGEPKAVSVEHRNVSTLLTSARDHLNFTEADRYFATSSLTFDASIPELFLPLTSGAKIVLRDRDIVLSPKTMVETMEATGVSIVQTTPSTWSAILGAVDRFPHVRLLITHGDPVTPAFAAELSTRAERVLNMYGPTETTVWATSLDVTPEIADTDLGAAPIGYPLDHIDALIVDPDGIPVAAGVPGELCLGGGSVTRGYRNDPERTAKVYFEKDAVRYYRTGDLVEAGADRLIRYLGRIDDQMAINGLRIEPGEIETALLTHPDVARAAVTWYATTPDARSIVAAVVPGPGKSLSPNVLRDHLSTCLNRSFLPSQYLIFSEVPTLTSGKVDRGAIRQAATEAHAPSETHAEVRPRTVAEQRLYDIWTSVLKTTDVALTDDFFSVGGDSLRAVDLMTRIERAFGVDLSIQDIFENPTLAELSLHLGSLAELGTPKTEDSLLVGIRCERPESPLFFAHADLDYPNGVGRSIPAPFYNLMLWSRAEGIVNEASLQDLAVKYVREILTVQARGPYRLAGYSIGGIIVHEVAAQLMALGHEIEFVFLVDPTPPGFTETAGRAAPVVTRKRNLSVRLSARLDRVVGSMRGQTNKGWARTLLETPRYLNEARYWWAYRRVTTSLANEGLADFAGLDEATRWRAIRYAIGRMVAKYAAKPLGVPTTLVTSNPDMAEAWESLLRPEDPRHWVQADHRGLFREAASAVWTALLIAEMTNPSNGLETHAPEGASEQSA